MQWPTNIELHHALIQANFWSSLHQLLIHPLPRINNADHLNINCWSFTSIVNPPLGSTVLIAYMSIVDPVHWLLIHPIPRVNSVDCIYINCWSTIHWLSICPPGSTVDHLYVNCWSFLHCWSAPRINSVDCLLIVDHLYIDCWSFLHWLLICPQDQQCWSPLCWLLILYIDCWSAPQDQQSTQSPQRCALWVYHDALWIMLCPVPHSFRWAVFALLVLNHGYINSKEQMSG